MVYYELYMYSVYKISRVSTTILCNDVVLRLLSWKNDKDEGKQTQVVVCRDRTH